MPYFLWWIFVFIVGQRLVELSIARRNEKWMKERGGVEWGREHYKWFIVVHTMFLFSILIEVMLRDTTNFKLNYFVFCLFLITQILRVWCISALGKFWNTKIIILPGHALISRGPYRYIKHPNYIIVGIELFIIPLLFQAYLTAILFPLLHILLMTIRIPIENKTLSQ